MNDLNILVTTGIFWIGVFRYFVPSNIKKYYIRLLTNDNIKQLEQRMFANVKILYFMKSLDQTFLKCLYDIFFNYGIRSLATQS